MAISANPYAGPRTTDDLSPRPKDLFRPLLVMLGILLSTTTVLGTIGRICFLVHYQEPWKALEDRLTDILPLLGLGIFAISVCCLLLATSCYNWALERDLPLCRGFISLAALAMFLRVISEPGDAWMLGWPSYLLTICAGIAMVMVLRRIRRDRESTVSRGIPQSHLDELALTA